MAAALSTSENVSTPSPRVPPSVLSSPSTSHKTSITYLRLALFSTHSLILVHSTKHCSPLGRVWILLFVSLLAWWPSTGWANSPINKFARVGNRGTRRKMPRKKGLTHHNMSGSWELDWPSLHNAQRSPFAFGHQLKAPRRDLHLILVSPVATTPFQFKHPHTLLALVQMLWHFAHLGLPHAIPGQGEATQLLQIPQAFTFTFYSLYSVLPKRLSWFYTT